MKVVPIRKGLKMTIARKIQDVALDLESCKTEVGIELQSLNTEISKVQKSLDVTNENTKELLEILEIGRSAIRLLGIIDSTFKWLVTFSLRIMAISAAVTAFWYSIVKYK